MDLVGLGNINVLIEYFCAGKADHARNTAECQQQESHHHTLYCLGVSLLDNEHVVDKISKYGTIAPVSSQRDCFS